jgi:hypothetical protein
LALVLIELYQVESLVVVGVLIGLGGVFDQTGFGAVLGFGCWAKVEVCFMEIIILFGLEASMSFFMGVGVDGSDGIGAEVGVRFVPFCRPVGPGLSSIGLVPSVD